MRVILSTRAVSPFHGYGGMQTYYYNLAKYLVKEGIDVKIVTSLDKTGKEFAEKDGIKFIFLPPDFNEKPFMSFWYRIFNLNIKRYLQKIEFDILHGTGGIYPYVLLKNRKPVIVQPYGLEPFKTRGFSKVRQFIMNYIPEKILLNKADAIASLGESNTLDIMNLFNVPRGKFFNLPNGVNLDLIEKYISNIKITKKDFGLQNADLVLINVNRLEKNKGIPYLIEALEILNQELNIKLILIGTGSQEQRIKEQIRRLRLQDKILHFKNISDEKMFQLYSLATISVTPTLYEGGCPPLVVLEAMACGKPIVGSNIELMQEGVDDGENGFLVPSKNPQAIADAILKIYKENLFEKMGKRSRQIVKNYDWSNITKIVIKKYEELLRKRKVKK